MWCHIKTKRDLFKPSAKAIVNSFVTIAFSWVE